MSAGLQAAEAALAPAQREVLETKRVDAARTPEDWTAMLAALLEYDTHADAMRRKAGIWLWITLLAGTAGAVALFLVLPAAGAVFAFAVVAACVLLFRTWRFGKRYDLPGPLLGTVLGVLDIVREDMAPGAQAHLRMDLRGARIEEKSSFETQPYQRGQYHHVVDQFYDDPWFSGTVQFVDGAEVSWMVLDRVRESKRRKRSASGKVKYKTKLKKTTYVTATVSLPAKNYAAAGNGGEAAPSKVRVKPGESRTSVKVRRVVKTADENAPLDPLELAAAIAEGYRRVSPTRRKRL